MDRFEALRVLVAAADGGSLSAASRVLNIPLPTVSRRVSDLEAHLGSKLLVRTNRNLKLTEAGTAFVASARRVLEVLSEAERAASGEYRTPRGALSITAPIMFGKLHVTPIVHDFLAAYPDVTVKLVLSDGVVDLIGLQLDVAVRIGPLPDSSLMARRIGEVRRVVCASPDYLADRGIPRSPDELGDHDCIALEGLESNRSWSFLDGGKYKEITIRPRYSVNLADAVVSGCAAGLGIARVMSYQAADSVYDGAITTILNEMSPAPLPVHLVHAPQQQQPLKLKAFLDFVSPRLGQKLELIAKKIETPRPADDCRRPASEAGQIQG